VILRRVLLFGLVGVLAAAAGLAARDFRAARGDRSEQASDDAASDVAAAPAATPTPKWFTRRVPLPADLAVWSVRISPDGRSLAGLSPDVSNVSVCKADKAGPPVCPTPTPQRVVRYKLDDPPGAIDAVVTRVADAPQNGGFAWLPDGGLVVAELETPAPGAKVGPKTVALAIVDQGGRTVPLGIVQASAVPQLPVSPDGKWLVLGESVPPQLRFIDRVTGASRVLALSDARPADPPNTSLAWMADGRVLYAAGDAVLLVSPDGAVQRVAGPSGERVYGVEAMSPDRQVAVVRSARGTSEGYDLFVDGRWVDAPSAIVRPVAWLGAHDLLLRAASGALSSLDARAGATRDLGFILRASDPRILAYADPYLMWRDGQAGRLHLLDTRSAYDVAVGVTDVQGVQPYAGGGFFIVHPSGAELLTGADWFARVPPTAAPFATAGPAKPGAKDPFAEIAALPRLDQFTTGGALEVVSRTSSSKRVRSPDGGWSLEIPADWRADVGRLRGGELYSFDPTGMDYSGNAPPPGGVRMSITLWPDFDRRGPGWFAENQGRPGRVTSREITTVTLAGTTAHRVITQEEQPGPFASTVARWYFRHPSFDDRIVEIILFRADAPALVDAERALATLQLFSAVSGPREPLLSRADAIARVMIPPGAKPTPTPPIPERIEAKLATHKEIELAQRSGANYSLDADTPVWLVVRFGEIEPVIRGGPLGMPSAMPRWGWQFALLDARTGQGFGGGGGGTPGTEPPWWSSLRDRAQ
jgi:hypothetical protein